MTYWVNGVKDEDKSGVFEREKSAEDTTDPSSNMLSAKYWTEYVSDCLGDKNISQWAITGLAILYGTSCELLIFGIVFKEWITTPFGLFASFFIEAILAQAGVETLPLTRVKIKNVYLRLVFLKSKNAIKLLMASVRTKGCNVWETNINRQCARKGMQHLQ
ncbi:hypothetical protein F0M21_08905 [Bacillus velezensis]|uniref:Uncharacterized protein n=1 Tax=Bacillus velezensis (strain DSM 23117 / BGSC 10A6 / LMG 26770 / FZB42) TaxID=326423 RepID=A7Z525_BACVZ|nr:MULTISPECIES: hypothetical protein [Bacillus amyloliquefaciens group]ABS74101.1 hypothetical protein RBAM_017380 [Bacillus velezensis FZB42]MBG9700650.1 hypothetical protein [Bacillus amyloliquefaciens]MBT9271617.1 hypothetical protein [Bacillus velezensis]MCF7602615.1 hypothetical protein [Bacillus velezensis]MDF0746812.1 hypothetical protein [Bacillus velezensis]